MSEENENKNKNVGSRPNHCVRRSLTYGLVIIITIIVIIFYSFQNFSKSKLVIPRYNHSSVVLQDGRILITGGETIIKGKSVKLNTAEIFNPKTKKSVLLSSTMNYARTTHTSILLQDGNVLVIGGDGDNMTGELFKIKTESFEQIIKLKNKKSNVSAKFVNKNKIAIFDSHSNKLEIYDIKVNKFDDIQTIINNDIYVPSRNIISIGNKIYLPISSLNTKEKEIDKDMHILKDKDLYKYKYKVAVDYDLSKNEIKYITKVTTDYDYSSMCYINSINKVEENLIFFCGNYKSLYAQNFNTQDNSWGTVSNKLDVSPFLISSIDLSNNNILLIIRELSKNNKNVSFVIYDITKNELFSVKPIISPKLNFYTVNRLKDETIIIIGGLNNKKVSKHIKIINIRKNKHDNT